MTSSATSQRIKDLEKDLEATCKWAIAAEKEIVELRAEAKAALSYKTLEEEVVALNKASDELEAGIKYWYAEHMKTAAELTIAKDKIEKDNEMIVQLIQERNALYESLG